MRYTITQNALAEILKGNRNLKRGIIIVPLIGSVVGYGSNLNRLYRGGTFDIGGFIVFVGCALIFFVFFLLSYKKSLLLNNHIIHEIEIENGNFGFRLSPDKEKNSSSGIIKVEKIKLLPANKGESIFFKAKDFMVFEIEEFGGRGYFIDEYFEETHLILEQLDIQRGIPETK